MKNFNTAPIIVGSEANFVPEKQRSFSEISHKWRCYVKIQPELVKAVHFRLHESFANPVIIVESAPFEIIEYGWGEFNIQIKIVLFNDERVLISHFLALHGDKYPLVSETQDTIVYKGKALEIEPEYDFNFEGESEEYRNIDKAIEYMLEKYEKASKI